MPSTNPGATEHVSDKYFWKGQNPRHSRAGGKVEVTVCDLWSSLDPLTADGAYPGLDQSTPITEGSTDCVVRWPASDLRPHVGALCRLKIRLEKARIFSLWFA